jgi:hypothetical protein
MTSADDVARVMWQLTERTAGDVADDWIVRQSTGGSTGSNQMLTRGTVRANGWVPRGTGDLRLVPKLLQTSANR